MKCSFSPIHVVSNERFSTKIRVSAKSARERPRPPPPRRQPPLRPPSPRPPPAATRCQPPARPLTGPARQARAHSAVIKPAMARRGTSGRRDVSF
eukprot:scaffold26766_cov96-Isochrysis_galbana.AAC.4